MAKIPAPRKTAKPVAKKAVARPVAKKVVARPMSNKNNTFKNMPGSSPWERKAKKQGRALSTTEKTLHTAFVKGKTYAVVGSSGQDSDTNQERTRAYIQKKKNVTKANRIIASAKSDFQSKTALEKAKQKAYMAGEARFISEGSGVNILGSKDLKQRNKVDKAFKNTKNLKKISFGQVVAKKKDFNSNWAPRSNGWISAPKKKKNK